MSTPPQPTHKQVDGACCISRCTRPQTLAGAPPSRCRRQRRRASGTSRDLNRRSRRRPEDVAWRQLGTEGWLSREPHLSVPAAAPVASDLDLAAGPLNQCVERQQASLRCELLGLEQ